MRSARIVLAALFEGTICIHNFHPFVIDVICVDAGQQETGFTSWRHVQRTRAQTETVVAARFEEESTEELGASHTSELSITTLNTGIVFGDVTNGASDITTSSTCVAIRLTALTSARVTARNIIGW